nr:RHS repeat-associated core domain-containing protein [Acidovorax sp. ACV01]
MGTNRYYTFGIVKGIWAVTAANTYSPTGKPDAATRVQNDVGLVTSISDFQNVSTNIQWDNSRRLPLIVTEATNRAESRTIQTTWHPQWRLPVTVTEHGRTTSYTYDSLGNPLTQTITDTGGGSGGSGSSRTTTWTYHASGLVSTETAPNGATTSYQYDSAGNLTSATNALGHVDTYTHDGAGRVLSHTAPTGLVATYTYDARGRMLTANRGGQLTTLTYRASGQVATASLPHGHVVTYTYDAAQRLTGWSDNRGHSGAYTLDAMGNRTQEDIRNRQGQTVWRLARTINSLNRVQSVTLGGQSTTFNYDGNGEAYAATNGLGQYSGRNLDALRRVVGVTNGEGYGASLSYNALDGVIQATDFKGVATTYTRDALGNATAETSPDSGAESAQYDALGLPSTITDALGQATTIERDLLGRPTLITHAGGRITSLRYDLTATGKGFLGEIVDASGTTTYQRDAHGRVTTKTQALINGDTRSVSYGYNAQGLLASTTYPGGQVLQNVYDTTGQLTGLTWAGQPLVTGITWSPLGQPTGWSWSLPGGTAAIPATRSYNTAGQVTATDFSSYQYDAAGRIQTLTQKLWRPASTNPQASTISQVTSTWTVQYSPAGRITGFTKNTAANAPVDTATFQYDANGNRTASTRDLAGTSTSRTYGGDASHNRLLGFEQTATSTTGNTATTSVTYQYNPAGDLLGDGLTTYRYDSEGRLESASTGQGEDAPTTKYAHNALGQRVFKTEPLYSGTQSSSTGNKTGKNLNNLLADDEGAEPAQAEQPGLVQWLLGFWSRLWSPGTSDAEKLGFSYVYAEDGSLLGEYGSGGTNSSGTAQYLYLPTASGPMPIAAVIKGTAYAIHSDHLNTPRKLTQADGQTAWQWAYSAFGDEQPTIGAKRFTNETTTPTTGATSIPEVTFNLRYPGQYFDKETKLNYNYHRSYAPGTGRYTQGDPIGLDGGWNRFGYVDADPLRYFDSLGLCRCENILEQAELLNNDSRYSLRAPYRPGPNTNKCNTFVDDVLESTGVAPRRNWLSMPISAGKWADPTATIPNFPVVTDPRPGDIVAIARWTPDSSGHVAIVKVPGVSTIGAGTEAGSHTTSWPWDLNKFPQGIPVYRRCMCQ